MSCIDEHEAQVVALTNNYRVQNGLPALKSSATLAAAATLHADDMAAGNFLSHTGSDGSSPGDRLKRLGYPDAAWAENAGAGYRDAAAVVRGWIDSPGHRANVLRRDVGEIGVAWATGPGTWGTYWVQVFGGASTAPARACGAESGPPAPVVRPALPTQPAPHGDRLRERIVDRVKRRLGLRP